MINDVILNGGMGAGEVSQFPRVSDIQLCIEKCCLTTKCHLAYVIQAVCYTVNCFSRDLCRTRPIEDTAVHSVIAYIKRNGQAMFSSANEASVMQLGNASVASPIGKPSPTAGAVGASQNNMICQKDRTFYNVQLKGGRSAGQFTERGQVMDISQCIGICCEERSCDLAYTEGQRCYTVKCNSQDTCKLIEASPLAVKTVLGYVNRLKDNNVLQGKINNSNPQKCVDSFSLSIF